MPTTSTCAARRPGAAHLIHQHGHSLLRAGAQEPFSAELFPGVGADEVAQMALDLCQRLLLDAQGELRLAAGEEPIVEAQVGVHDMIAAQPRAFPLRDRHAAFHEARILQDAQIL